MYDRRLHGCHIFDEEGKMVAAGGRIGKSNSVTGTVEILDLETRQWKVSPQSLPDNIFYVFVNHHDNFVALSRPFTSDTIFAYSVGDDSWQRDEDTMLVGGPTTSAYLVAVNVEDLQVCRYKD